jgi:CubicO group peptidase (beta-lactamase class C family)
MPRQVRKIRSFLIVLSILLGGVVLSTLSEATGREVLKAPMTLTDANVGTNDPGRIEYHSEEATRTVTRKLDSLLTRINKRHDFHGTVVVLNKGKVVYENQIGYADFRSKEKISESSVFQLASVSKQFTAAAILLLYERGKLHLSDPVTKFFPDFPYAEVTVKQLMNHTAGLPKYFWIAEHHWKQEKAPDNAEMMELMAASKVQRFFPPGRNFDYSNTAYLVLASIVEEVANKSYGDFLTEHIFEPLGMEDSFVYRFGIDEIRDGQLTGYRLYRGWRHLKIGGTVNDAVVGDKNVYSTGKDLVRWINGLNEGRVLRKETLNLMYTKGETVYGRKVPYGLGFRIDTRDEPRIYHYGKWNGFSTALTQYPEEELTVIVLEHTSYPSMTHLNKKIRYLVKDYFRNT